MPGDKRGRDSATGRTPFNAQAFLDAPGIAAKVIDYARDETVFRQGDACDAIMYIRTGGVKLSVRSKTGRDAVVALLGPGDFFGEGCLAGQPVRMGTATALTPSVIVLIDKGRMIRLLRQHHALSDRFIAHLLARNLRFEQDLVDQLFNTGEKRLARALLLLARHGNSQKPIRVPSLTQAMLAGMIGTTRSRVNFFLNRFKRLGFIEYDETMSLKVNSSLLSVVLHD